MTKKKYQVTYLTDVTHRYFVEVEAENAEEAIELAAKENPSYSEIVSESEPEEFDATKLKED